MPSNYQYRYRKADLFLVACSLRRNAPETDDNGIAETLRRICSDDTVVHPWMLQEAVVLSRMFGPKQAPPLWPYLAAIVLLVLADFIALAIWSLTGGHAC